MKIREPTQSSPRERSPRAGLPWSDFQLVLTVAREGSVARACVRLGMTHSTLLRKLDQIESRLKTRLFERVRGQYSLTPAGEEIEQAARNFEPLAAAAETRVRGQDLRPNGEVRVSVASIVLDHLLPPVLTQFAMSFPQVQIELAASREQVSLRRREADVALRVADSVPQWLVGRQLANLRFRIYGRRHPAMGTPVLRPLGDLAAERRWIGFERDARDLKFDRWLAAEIPDANVVLRVDDFNHALTMVRAGLGVALLPQFLEACVPDLLPLSEPITQLETPMWLITHPELRHTARVQVLMRAFAPALSNTLRRMQGDVPDR